MTDNYNNLPCGDPWPWWNGPYPLHPGQWHQFTVPAKVPHKCPVCEGRGHVPKGFYDPPSGPVTDDLVPEPCRACDGNGVILT